MPSRRRPDPETTVSVSPNQLRPGDRFADPQGGEWEIIRGPWGMASGKTVYAYVQRPGDTRALREVFWGAHERITVRRSGEAASRPKPEAEPAPAIEALQAEIRRLRGQVVRLEEDKRVLEERLAFVKQDLEKMRKKVPKEISTS